ncbi:hypothetical protein HII12_000872 [Brettanomyces bruxellensis]|uniref:Phosphatidic acid phosphatase type 2/haloperoxidase domain-containing protein n=1 Tax=Dekkera bruxellensis TaxID=5007 RepID=A0A8H6BPT0_DEKBR|nr:hypothetical protein HII12_000872 [Brettanomyces bruxellensis]
MITTTATRLGTPAPSGAQYIRMTSFDDERSSSDFPRSRSQSLSVQKSALDTTRRLSVSAAAGNEKPPAATRSRSSTYGRNSRSTQSFSHHEEHHTGFFLFNLILMLYDEYKAACRDGNLLVGIRVGYRPSLRKFRHLTGFAKANVALCTFVFLLVLYIIPVHLFFKLAIATALITVCTVPVLSQFFFYAMPVLAWVFFFFSASKFPQAWRPPISVKVLPAMENILYGDNLSNILAAYHNTFLDLLAWLPYGIVHFAGPFVVAALIWLFGPPTALRYFSWSFGYMNLLGVVMQQLAPAAPPWYKNLYGLAAANYGMSGSPGGLARIDQLFGFDMYTSTFSNSPIIFGALPSLHSACSTMSALWLSYLFPKFKICFIGYVCWLWWSTMYLTHHYFFDLTTGTAMAISFFYMVKLTYLPVRDPRCWCRFDYTEIKQYNLQDNDPLSDQANDDSGDVLEATVPRVVV